jgi:DNA-binding HxlR family transcriptional regulator
MKGKKTNLKTADCAIARSLGVIGDWWSLLILREAFAGTERFGEFQVSLGLAKNILASRLKKLVEEGIFEIQPDAHSSKSHRYVLTPKAEGLGVVLIALWQWGERALFEPGELVGTMVDRTEGVPLAKLQLASIEGRKLGPRDYRLQGKNVRSSA